MYRNDAAPLLWLNHYEAAPAAADALARVIVDSAPWRDRPLRALYREAGGPRFMELLAMDHEAELADLLTVLRTRSDPGLDRLLARDVRRELLSLRACVKPFATGLPSSPRLQRRCIEVPPPRFDEYHAWREHTIFADVRKRPEIHGFGAYHSLLSTDPGVSFFVEFVCSLAELEAGFQTAHYLEIVRQAGDRFIVGGSRRLATILYERTWIAPSASVRPTAPDTPSTGVGR